MKNHRRSNLRGVLATFLPARPAPHVEYVRVVNLTRDSSLGDCVEVAGSGAQRRKGLLGRTGLGPGEGLWIVPCEAVHTFGMKFAIDLVYLGRDRRIVKIRHSVPPSRLSGCVSAQSVLELPAGTVAQVGAAVGDRLALQPASPPRD